jgi:hypothetical protein
MVIRLFPFLKVLQRKRGKQMLRYAKQILSIPVLALVVAFLSYAQQPASQPVQNTSAPRPSDGPSESASTYDELKQLLKTRYDGKTLVAAVQGLYAGEQRKELFGPGSNGIVWSHFAANMQVPDRIGSAIVGGKKTSDLTQLDDHTFGNLRQGLNVSPISKGETLKVHKFYVTPEGIELVLSTTGLQHMRDLDYQKASKEVTTTLSGNQVNQGVSVGGFGMAFVFYFNKGIIKGDHDYTGVVREIDKYLLPQSEAATKITTTQTVALGQSPAEVETVLGKPEKIVDLGQKKIYVYKDMKIVFVDGKVADVQ